MKSIHPTDKTRRHPSAAKSTSGRADGQLFLGHKVLGELRILMRLATPNGSATNGNTDSHGRSY